MNRKEFVMVNKLKATCGIGNAKIVDIIKLKSLDVNSESPKDRKIENVYDFCAEKDIQIISYSDRQYPEKLKRIPSPPPIIYCKGDASLLDRMSIAIVGSRESSAEAIGWVRNIAKDLADGGVVVVSGGARGVDTAVHETALDSEGKTICVLGSGLDNIYPKENAELFEKISKKGLLVSEMLPDKNVNRFSLLERNRITSGISGGVLVATSKINGGAMEQFKVAKKQGKKIFVPAVDLRPSDGIKYIVRNGFGTPVSGSSEILQALSHKNKQHLKSLLYT